MTEMVILLLDLGNFINVLHMNRAHHLVHRFARTLLHCGATLVSEGGAEGMSMD